MGVKGRRSVPLGLVRVDVEPTAMGVDLRITRVEQHGGDEVSRVSSFDEHAGRLLALRILEVLGNRG